MAGFGALKQFGDWVGKKHNSLVGENGWTDEAKKANQGLYGALETLNNQYSNPVNTWYQKKTGNTWEGGDNEKNKFQSLGYDLNNVKNWVNKQKKNYNTEYNNILAQYAYQDPSTYVAETPEDIANSLSGIDKKGLNIPDDQLPGATQPAQNNDYAGTNDWLLNNRNRPIDAVLTGLKQDYENMNANNQHMLNEERQRADSLMDMLRNNAKTKTTENYEDILARNVDYNSPLMQRAIAKANEQMNARGLLNSSMSAGAAQAAVLDKAMEIANSELSGQQNNARESNQTQRNLVNEMGQTGRNSLDFMQDIYSNQQQFGHDTVADRQGFVHDNITNDRTTANQIDELDAAHRNEMEKASYEYAQQRYTELLGQKASIDRELVAGLAQIDTSDIPASAKDKQKRALIDEVEYSKQLLDQFNAFPVYLDANGHYQVGKPSKVDKRKTTTSTNTSTNSGPYNMEQARIDENSLKYDVDNIYKQVRVGGGDTPEEGLIDNWARLFNWAKANDETLYLETMKIYNEKGLGSNWESTINAMIDKIRPTYLAWSKNRSNLSTLTSSYT